MFWKVLYNVILLPFLFLIIFIGTIFNSKIRAGFLGRLKSKKKFLIPSLKIQKMMSKMFFGSMQHL